MTEFGGKVLFSAFGATGEELYITDGTAAGTVLVKDIRPGTASSNPFDLCVFGNLCYFQAADDLAGTELWRTDGTAAGTVMVSDINPGTAGSSPKGMIVAQGRLFFSATSASTGEELFTSDGTANGTVMVNDIFPGLAGSSPSRFVAAGSGVYFSADSGSGLELHVSDGTAAGTGLVCDLNAAAPGSSPTDLTISDGLLYFAASSDIYGRKLFRLGVSPASVEATGVGCGGQAPVLTASHPLLGGTCTISGRGPNTGARLLIAGLPSPPFRVPGLVAADCAIWVNLSLTLVVPLPASANWSIPVGIPNTPSTIGVKVMLQAAHDPLPLSLSNGLQLTIGR
jgi:ELWxxDGT repeat protein